MIKFETVKTLLNEYMPKSGTCFVIILVSTFFGFMFGMVSQTISDDYHTTKLVSSVEECDYRTASIVCPKLGTIDLSKHSYERLGKHTVAKAKGLQIICWNNYNSRTDKTSTKCEYHKSE